MRPADDSFDRGAAVYPQPVAVACGRICRSRTQAERLERVLKCAEVLTRYVAALALVSFAAREDAAVTPPRAWRGFRATWLLGIS